MSTARVVLLLLSFLLASVVVASAPARHDVFSPLIETATAARMSRDFATAEAGYREVLTAARQGGDTIWEFRALFYLGLTRQEAAEEPQIHDRPRMLREAKAFYEQALTVNPASSATLMNLQEAQWASDDEEGSRRSLERGLALGDERAFQFAGILGDRYANAHDTAKAMKYYRMSVELPGATAELRHSFVDKASVYGAREELIGYIRKQLAANEVDVALDVTYRALEETLSPAASWPELPVVLALALAKKDYDPVVFAGSEARRRLEPLMEKSPQREQLRGIWNLSTFQLADTASFKPWRDSAEGATAFRSLAASIGSSEFRQGRFDRAERYYTIALSESGDKVDPALLADLAITYASQKKMDAVDDLVKAYEDRLQMQQEMAAPEELDVYYEYHRMIASIYGSLGRRDPRRVNHLEELEHATQVSDAVVEPKMFEQLALIYQRRGEDSNAREAWLSRAEALRRDGNFNEVRESLVLIEIPELEPMDQRRYFDIVNDVVTLQETGDFGPEAVLAIKHSLLLLSTRGANRRQRAASERKLRDLGITANVPLRQIGIVSPAGTRTTLRFDLPVRTR